MASPRARSGSGQGRAKGAPLRGRAEGPVLDAIRTERTIAAKRLGGGGLGGETDAARRLIEPPFRDLSYFRFRTQRRSWAVS
jgi:hypothetical protein